MHNSPMDQRPGRQSLSGHAAKAIGDFPNYISRPLGSATGAKNPKIDRCTKPIRVGAPGRPSDRRPVASRAVRAVQKRSHSVADPNWAKSDESKPRQAALMGLGSLLRITAERFMGHRSLWGRITLRGNFNITNIQRFWRRTEAEEALLPWLRLAHLGGEISTI